MPPERFSSSGSAWRLARFFRRLAGNYPTEAGSHRLVCSLHAVDPVGGTPAGGTGTVRAPHLNRIAPAQS